jgi:hypothetical protein
LIYRTYRTIDLAQENAQRLVRLCGGTKWNSAASLPMNMFTGQQPRRSFAAVDIATSSLRGPDQHEAAIFGTFRLLEAPPRCT